MEYLLYCDKEKCVSMRLVGQHRQAGGEITRNFYATIRFFKNLKGLNGKDLYEEMKKPMTDKKLLAKQEETNKGKTYFPPHSKTWPLNIGNIEIKKLSGKDELAFYRKQSQRLKKLIANQDGIKLTESMLSCTLTLEELENIFDYFEHLSTFNESTVEEKE